MKKIVSLLLILIIACTSLLASAEEFTIHAGTKFGDTIDEVLEKETLERIMEDKSGKDYAVLYYEGTVAGFPKVHIVYYFQNNDMVLDRAAYHIASSLTSPKKVVLDDYNQLITLLIDKYGEPLTEENDVYRLKKGRLSTVEGLSKNNVKNGKEAYDIRYNCWVVPYDEYTVKIDLFYDDDGTTSECEIEYYTYTEEKLEKYKEAEKRKKQKQSDDL